MLPVMAYIAMQIPAVQTFIAQKATEFLSDKIEGQIYIDKISIALFNRLNIKDAYIVGKNQDTLSSFKKLNIHISPHALTKGKINIYNISLKDGSFNYIVNADGTNNLNRIFKLDPNRNASVNLPELYINDLKLRRFKFKYMDYRKLKEDEEKQILKDPDCIDFADIDVSDIFIDINKIQIDDQGVLKANIKRVLATDKSGWGPRALKGEVVWSKKEVRINDLYLKDNFSTVEARYLSFFSHKKGDLRHFIDKIIMTADFTHTLFDFRTLGKINPIMRGNTLKLYLKGPVTGPVRDLYAEDITLSTLDQHTEVNLTTRIHGLPKISKTLFNAELHHLETTPASLSQAINDFTGKASSSLLDSLPANEKFSFNGSLNGYLSEFNSEGSLTSETIGNLMYAAVARNNANVLKIDGKVGSHLLDLSKVLNTKMLGTLSMDSKFSFGLSKKDKAVTFKTPETRIHHLVLNRYDFQNIFITGNYSDSLSDAKVICHDPHLNFIFQAVNANRQGKDHLEIYLDLPFADLNQLGINQINKKSDLRFKAISNISSKRKSGKEYKDFFGTISLKDIYYNADDEEYYFNDINLHSISDGQLFTMALNTPFMNAKYHGDFSFMNFVNKISTLIKTKEFSEILQNRSDSTSYDLVPKAYMELKTSNTNDICSILSPDFKIADNSGIKLEITEDLKMNLRARIDHISYGKKLFSNISLNCNNYQGPLTLNLLCREALVNQTTLENNHFSAQIKDSIIDVQYQFANLNTNHNQLKFQSEVWFGKDSASNNVTHIRIKESPMRIKDFDFTIASSLIQRSSNFLTIDNFQIKGKNQGLSIHGKITDHVKDSMFVDIDNFDLSFLNALSNDKIQFSGIINGNIEMARIFNENPKLLMNVYGRDITLYDQRLGDLRIMSKWSEVQDQFNLLLNNSLDGRNQVNIIGFYKPQHDIMNFNVSLDRLNMSYAGPIFRNLIEDAGGSLSGKIQIKGSRKNISINNGSLDLQDVQFTPLYTGVPYTLNGKIESKDRIISLKNIKIQDDMGNLGNLDADLSHRDFKDLYVDAKLGFKNLHCLKTKEEDNSTFYGDVFATGNVGLSGYLNDIVLDFAFKTEEKTEVHIPLSSSSSASKTDLLSFTKNAGYYVQDHFKQKIEKKKSRKNKIQIKGKADINHNAKLLVEINKQMGDIIKCSGNGLIDVNLDPNSNKIDVRGDYTIAEGNYTFVLLGITAKDFIINNGASLSFNGDLANTTLNLQATYRTKASVSTLIGDKTAVESRRNIDCGIHLNGPLRNPQLSFSIDIPDLDPITKGKTESVLSSNDKIQKQFMALLISGSFIPDEQSGIVNNTTLLYSNAADIVSNQFNNVFRQLDIPLDLGLNYQPGANGRNDLFDVALSYQAFNNRVLINGNVGTGQKSSRDWTGNFEAEVKIDKAGKFRVKLFTRSADDYSNYLDNTQRSGLGFTIQDEFDNIKDLFRSIFWSRKRKDEYELKLLKEAEEELLKEAGAVEHKVLIPKEIPDEYITE